MGTCAAVRGGGVFAAFREIQHKIMKIACILRVSTSYEFSAEHFDITTPWMQDSHLFIEIIFQHISLPVALCEVIINTKSFAQFREPRSEIHFVFFRRFVFPFKR